ncbi:hypothetical protein C8Q80DRAFT_736539 [Daedaleopsis nitida]|nr:hypothetical protein C8Q80DRAFT_736539 [Daedaleopsis nitida]
MELVASPNPSNLLNDVLPYVPPRLSELVIREELSVLPRMVHLIGAPPTVYTHLEVVCYDWRDWEEGDFHQDEELPIFLDLFMHHSQKASSSGHPPYTRMVLIVGAEQNSIASLAAYSEALRPQWSMVILLETNWSYRFSSSQDTGFGAVCPTVLNELATIGMSVEPTALEIHIAPSIDHFCSPALWLAMSRAYLHVVKLSIGCAKPSIIRELFPVLSDPGSFPALEELSLCIAQWQTEEAKTVRQCLNTRLSTQVSPVLKLTVEFVMSKDDLRSVAAVVLLVGKLSPSVCFVINRDGCPTCHRAFTESDIEMWKPRR